MTDWGLSKKAFWDVRFEEIDFENHARFVIEKGFQPRHLGRPNSSYEPLRFGSVKKGSCIHPLFAPYGCFIFKRLALNTKRRFQMLDFATIEPTTLELLNMNCQIPELDSFGLVGARNPGGFAIIEISKGL